MKRHLRLLFIWAFPFFATVVSFIFFAEKLIFIIDSLFYIGLLLLTAAGVFSLIQGGFFRFFLYSWRRFYATISKREATIREIERRNEKTESFDKQFPFLQTLWIVGSYYALFGLIISLCIVILAND